MNATCFECGQPARHAHHVVPKSRGGTRTIPLCAACHRSAHVIDTITLQREAIDRDGTFPTLERDVAIWRYVEAHPWCTTRDLKDRGIFDGLRTQEVYDQLKGLRLAGYLVSTRKGQGHELRHHIGKPLPGATAAEIRQHDFNMATEAFRR